MDKISIPLEKAGRGLPSVPCSGVGALKRGERFISCGFILGDNSLVRLAAGMSRGPDPGTRWAGGQGRWSRQFLLDL